MQRLKKNCCRALIYSVLAALLLALGAGFAGTEAAPPAAPARELNPKGPPPAMLERMKSVVVKETVMHSVEDAETEEQAKIYSGLPLENIIGPVVFKEYADGNTVFEFKTNAVEVKD